MDWDKIFIGRYFCLLAVLFPLFGALLMFLLGAYKTLQAIYVSYYGLFYSSASDPFRVRDGVVMLIRSVDSFLIGLFLIVFSYSVHALFLKGATSPQEKGPFPWLKMEGLDQLKTALAQLVIIILFVLFLDRVMASEHAQLGLKDLVLPGSILCLAAAKRLLRQD